jgi:threonine dehydratase
VTPTPLEAFADGVWLKREDVHELGAFKWRGAVAVLEARRPEVVVTASTGNHGAATAWAAKRAGVRAVVFVPEGASATKTGMIEANGAELRYVGADVDEAKDAARAFAAVQGSFFFEDGAEPAQFDGYAAIGRELVEQLGRAPGSVLVPVGNGALAIGVGRGVGPEALRIGVVPEAAPVMWESWEAGRALVSDRMATFADGLAVRVAIPLAVEELPRSLDRVELVTEQELAGAVKEYGEAGIRVEGAAAAPLAALRKLHELPEPVVLIVTGRNIDDELYGRVLAAAAN